jgi:hypothetical protein
VLIVLPTHLCELQRNSLATLASAGPSGKGGPPALTVGSDCEPRQECRNAACAKGCESPTDLRKLG